MEKRNYTIDVLRIILAFLVVCIHFPISGLLGLQIKYLARVAVPLFFMISGFFIYNADVSVMIKRIKKQIKSIGWICLWSFILYFVFDIMIVVAQNENINDWLCTTFSFRNIVEFLLLNDSPVLSSLWFLFSLLYDLVILYFVAQKIDIKKTFVFIIVLWAFRIVLGNYSYVLLGKKINILFTKNFLFTGMLNVLLGCWISAYKEKLCKIFNNIQLLFCIIFFSATTLLEANIIEYFNKTNVTEYYISTIFLTISIFLICLKNPILVNNKLYKELAIIGSSYALYVYVFHRMIGTIIDFFANHMQSISFRFYTDIKAVLVFLVTLLFSIVYVYIYQKFKLILQKKKVIF